MILNLISGEFNSCLDQNWRADFKIADHIAIFFYSLRLEQAQVNCLSISNTSCLLIPFIILLISVEAFWDLAMRLIVSHKKKSNRLWNIFFVQISK